MSQTPAPADETTEQSAPRASGVSLPAFRQPLAPPSRQRRQSSPRSANPSQGLPSTPAPDEDDDASAWDGGQPEPETDSTSYPASTEVVPSARIRPINPSARALYEKTVFQGSLIASGLVNSRMDPDGGAFVMTQDEAESVAVPTSRLLARHVPMGAGVTGAATDLSDVVELLGAVVGYVMAAFARKTATRGYGSGMPSGDEGDTSDLYRYGGHDTAEQEAAEDDTPPAAPLPAWPMPAGMPPLVGAGA